MDYLLAGLYVPLVTPLRADGELALGADIPNVGAIARCDPQGAEHQRCGLEQ